MSIKDILITKSAKVLSEPIYVKYLELLSRAFNKVNPSYHAIHIRKHATTHTTLGSITIWKVSNSHFEIITPSGFRSSRFLKGFTHAADRQWNRYGISELLLGGNPEAVLDIGANIGEFTFAAQQRGIRSVYAFEPDPIAFNCLLQNVRGQSINLFNIALGENTGEGTFFSAAEGADSSLIRPIVKSSELKVPIYRLDELAETREIKGNVLVKMDAEGAEPEVLRGFEKFAHRISWISIDVGPERYGRSTREQAKSLLQKMGFKTSLYSEWILHGRR